MTAIATTVTADELTDLALDITDIIAHTAERWSWRRWETLGAPLLVPCYEAATGMAYGLPDWFERRWHGHRHEAAA